MDVASFTFGITAAITIYGSIALLGVVKRAVLAIS